MSRFGKTADNLADAVARAAYLARIATIARTGPYPVSEPAAVYSVVEFEAPRRGKAGRYAVTTAARPSERIVAQFTVGE